MPTTEWHCNLCRERIALRESRHTSSHLLFEGSSSIERHRSKQEEEALLNACVDRRLSVTGGGGGGKGGVNANNINNSSSASLSAMEPEAGEVSERLY